MKSSFKDLTRQELMKKREDLTKELQDHRFNVVLGHVDNPVGKRTLRRQIARLNTMIHEFDVGIRKA